jgi:hypothetical protein
VPRDKPYGRQTVFSQYDYSTPYAPEVPQKTLSKTNDRTLSLAVTFTLAVLLTIGISLGALLPQRYIKSLPVTVLVPFYLNPEEGAWKRLYDAYAQPPCFLSFHPTDLELASQNTTIKTSPSLSTPRTVPGSLPGPRLNTSMRSRSLKTTPTSAHSDTSTPKAGTAMVPRCGLRLRRTRAGPA